MTPKQITRNGRLFKSVTLIVGLIAIIAFIVDTRVKLYAVERHEIVLNGNQVQHDEMRRLLAALQEIARGIGNDTNRIDARITKLEEKIDRINENILKSINRR